MNIEEGERLLAARKSVLATMSDLQAWKCWLVNNAPALLAAARERDTLAAEVERLKALPCCLPNGAARIPATRHVVRCRSCGNEHPASLVPPLEPA